MPQKPGFDSGKQLFSPESDRGDIRAGEVEAEEIDTNEIEQTISGIETREGNFVKYYFVSDAGRKQFEEIIRDLINH